MGIEETTQEIHELLEAKDTDRLVLIGAKRIADLLAPAIDEVSHLPGNATVSRELAMRCIGKRTHEMMLAVIALAESGYAYAAPTLLRPMCEDLIFAEWLLTLSAGDAEEYIQQRALQEIVLGKIAQARFFPDARKRFGLEPGPSKAKLIEGLEKGLGGIVATQKKLSERAGWGKRISPSVRRMAELTDRLPEYEFFYHGVSKSVHSSPHHMLRMVWRKNSRSGFVISSNNFRRYHYRFALIYSVWLGTEVIEVLEGVFPELLMSIDRDSYSVWMALTVVPPLEHEAPPIVTDEELFYSPPE